jgi:two-component system, chemotaxis family, CheB/CheR fusion protein
MTTEGEMQEPDPGTAESAAQDENAAAEAKTGADEPRLQHLDPHHESLMGELLSKHTRMPVVEELETVNTELSSKIDELSETNSDLKNLLESTRIATIFLDGELRIKSFTPPMGEVST